MNNTLFSFFITALAGFSTLFGLFPCFMSDKNKDNIINFSLSFSAGVMIFISIFSLIPEGVIFLYLKYDYFKCLVLGSFSLGIGFLISKLIDKKTDSIFNNNKLYQLGIVSIIALVLHNIPEGITTFVSTKSNVSLGLTLSLGIALHNIPEGMSIAIPIFYSTGSFFKAFLYTAIAGFSELFGSFIAYLFLTKYINNNLLAIILFATAGIMIYISICELLPMAFSYKKNKASSIALLLGFIVMMICEVILH